MRDGITRGGVSPFEAHEAVIRGGERYSNSDIGVEIDGKHGLNDDDGHGILNTEERDTYLHIVGVRCYPEPQKSLRARKSDCSY